MNKSYRSIFSEQTGAWVAVPEITNSKGKKSKSAIVAAAIAVVAVPMSDVAQAQLVFTTSATTNNGNVVPATAQLQTNFWENYVGVTAIAGQSTVMHTSVVGGVSNTLDATSLGNVVVGYSNEVLNNTSDAEVYGVSNSLNASGNS